MEDMVNDVVTDVVENSTEAVVEEVGKNSEIVSTLVKMGIGGAIVAGAIALGTKVIVPAAKKGIDKFKVWKAANKAQKEDPNSVFETEPIPEIEEPKK
jgi:hypothetical protein